jgi:hypothetical protein
VLPDDLLRGPRGRRLCWELIGFASFDPGRIPRSRVSAYVARTVADLRSPETVAGERIFRALGESANVAMYWQEPDECDFVLADPEWADALRPVAEAVAVSGSVDWWSTQVDLANQHYDLFLEREEAAEAPTFSGARQAVSRWRAGVDDQNLAMRRLRTSTGFAAPGGWGNVSGSWWSAPSEHPIRSTTRALTAFGPVGLWLVEDTTGLPHAATWPVRPTRAPRVFEITGDEAWSELVLRHPVDVSDARGPDWQRVTGRLGTWLIPNWESVAEEYDAVHLTALGYVTSAGRTIPVAPDAASLIGGWAPDRTYWLADILEIAGPPTHWVEGEGWRSVPSLEG